MSKLKYLLTPLILSLPSLSFGQEAVAEHSFFAQYQVEIVLGLAVVVCLVAVLAMYVTVTAMRVIVRAKQIEEGTYVEKPAIAVKAGEEGMPFWRRFWNRVHDSVPISREAEVATSHEYDGIRELDNRLPPWWLYGFYFTIAFGAIYLIRFFFLEMPRQEDEFQAEMQQAKEEVQLYLASLDNLIDENSVTLASETAELNAGKAIFEKNCAVCHANDGGGGVGPNLTDKYWLHGGDMPSIFSTIKYGVPSKGMISWETQLSPKKIQQVASYIYFMEGTVPATPKEAQGDLFERAIETEEESDEVEEDKMNEGTDATEEELVLE